MPAPHERRYYTASPDGRTHGPYPAAQLAQFLTTGHIDYNTPVCGEGDQQWTTFAAIAPYLGVATPPPLPAGPPPAAAQAGWGQPAAAQRSADGTKGLRLGMLLGALALFFLPWLEFRCGSQGIAQQTGYNAAMGTASLTSAMKDMAKMGGGDPEKEMEKDSKDGPKAWLVVGAAGAIVLALLVGLGGSAAGSGLLSLVAAGLLGAQIVTGFPLEKDFKEKMEQSGLGGANSPLGPPGKSPFDTGTTASPADAQSKEMEKQMQMLMGSQMKTEVAILPSLWGELALLVVCGILGLKPRRH